MSEPLCGRICDLPSIDPGAHMLGGEKRIVFGPERYWDTHVMRCFTLKPGGIGLYASEDMGNSRSVIRSMILRPGHGYLCPLKSPIPSGMHPKPRIWSVSAPLPLRVTRIRWP